MNNMKDNLLCLLMAFLFAFFGGAILIGFEVCNYAWVAAATLLGGVIGTVIKESRRARFENGERDMRDSATVWSYVSYGLGTVIALVVNWFLAQAQAASIAA